VFTTGNGTTTTGNGTTGIGSLFGTFGTNVNGTINNSTGNGTTGNNLTGNGTTGNGTTTGFTGNNAITTNINGNFNRTDIRWLNQAAAGSLQEIALGNLAQTNSSDTNVQAFGALLVQDHTLAFEQAQQLGATNGLTLPTAVTRTQQRDTQRLSRLTGTSFDAAFLALMIRNHITDIQSYETEAQRGGSADVRAYARSQLPILMNHLVIALDLQDSLGLRTVRR